VIRIIGLLFLLAGVMLGVAWFADRPGNVTIVWQGWRIDTSVGVLMAGVLALTIAGVIVYRLWRTITDAPRTLGRWRRESKRRRGYVALTQGLVAVAAGDPQEARRHARRADALLSDPPLTLLLTAQAAQLSGDEDAAKRYFTQMLERPETEFLGLRGLLIQAMRVNDTKTALSLARRAAMLQPKAPWVLTTLFELETRSAAWGEAAATLERAQRVQALPDDTARRHRAAVLLERARASLAAGQPGEALRFAEQAHRADARHPAVAPFLAERYNEAGKTRASGKLIEDSWARQPHPDLVTAYRRARPVAEPLQWVKQVERLVRLAPTHTASLTALAEANLDARLWGEARRNLMLAGGESPSAHICRLMARIEDEEKQDAAAVRAWLARAADAPRDPSWTCEACGAIHPSWQAVCSRCHAFDRLAWRAPLRVDSAIGAPTIVPPAVTAAPSPAEPPTTPSPPTT
jgi:HemY protein